MFKCRQYSINQLLTNIPILHPLETPKNQRFSSVYRGHIIRKLDRNGLIMWFLFFEENCKRYRSSGSPEQSEWKSEHRNVDGELAESISAGKKLFSPFPSCISESFIKIKIKFLFSYFFVVPQKALKAFIKPFEAPERSVKIKFKLISLFSFSIGTVWVNSFMMEAVII